MARLDFLPEARDITTKELVSTFQTLANQTRVEALWAIWATEKDVVPFSEIMDGVSARDSGNINYHLDRLEGELITHTPDRGYSLQPPAYFIINIAMCATSSGLPNRPTGVTSSPNGGHVAYQCQ